MGFESRPHSPEAELCPQSIVSCYQLGRSFYSSVRVETSELTIKPLKYADIGLSLSFL